jgi:hypothetical protein
MMEERDELRAELSLVMKERRDALQRAWDAERDVKQLCDAAEKLLSEYVSQEREMWSGDEAVMELQAVLDKLMPVVNEAGPIGSAPPITEGFEWVNGSLHRKVSS